MKQRDPYLWDDAPVIKNLLGIKTAVKLEEAEANITYIRLQSVDGTVADLPFALERFLQFTNTSSAIFTSGRGQSATFQL
jgi:hypothetical protein